MIWWTKPKLKKHSSLLGRALNRWGEGLQALRRFIIPLFSGTSRRVLVSDDEGNESFRNVVKYSASDSAHIREEIKLWQGRCGNVKCRRELAVRMGV
jgi:hypothetical protein